MKTVDTTRYSELRELFGKVFDAQWSREDLDNFDELRDKFVFHMTDAIDDVVSLAELYRTCQSCDEDKAGKLVYAFFLHAVPHLTAAGQIYDCVPETFEEQKGVHVSE